MIFDTHAHYDDRQFDTDREALLASLPAHGIGRVVDASSDLASLEKVCSLTEKHDWIYGAFGIHPEELAEALGLPEVALPVQEDKAIPGQMGPALSGQGAAPAEEKQTGTAAARQESGQAEPDPDKEEVPSALTEKELENRIRSFCRLPKAVAVGEIGLDYYWEKNPGRKAVQRNWFRRQLQIAREEQLPVIIHSRDAAEDTLRIAKEEKIGEIGGVMHCYSYSVEMAREYLDMGLYLGIGGVVTFKNSRKLKETVAYAPLSQLVLETDCPYLAPVPHRGKRNCSLYIPLVAEEIARIKGITPEEVEAVTWENACRLYRMKEVKWNGSI